MVRHTLANPGIITSYQTGMVDEWASYVISVAGSRRVLQTTEYYEGGMEMSEARAFAPSSWGVEVPESAELFAATSGITPANAHQFWVGWLMDRRLHMQALMQEGPIDAVLAVDETPIFPAVMSKAGLAALYSWRPVPAGMALWRRVFSGQIKTQGSSVTEALSEIPGHPLISVAGAIPGEPTQHAVIGWVESTVAGAVLGMAIIRPDSMRVVRSDPIPDWEPLARQRPGLWASAPPADQRFELAVALRSRATPHSYTLARFSVGAKAEERTVSVRAIDVPRDQLHAAAFDYLKDHVEPKFHCTYLTIDGGMWVGGTPQVRRQNVALDSALPVLTTRRAYWGVRSTDDTLTLERF
jgi:hypothetical protein